MICGKQKTQYLGHNMHQFENVPKRSQKNVVSCIHSTDFHMGRGYEIHLRSISQPCNLQPSPPIPPLYCADGKMYLHDCDSLNHVTKHPTFLSYSTVFIPGWLLESFGVIHKLQWISALCDNLTIVFYSIHFPPFQDKYFMSSFLCS